MKKISFISSFRDNECFKKKSKFNRDGFLNFIIELKEAFYVRGFDISTSDINKPEDSDVLIFNEAPVYMKKYASDKIKILIYLESSIVNRRNVKAVKQNKFDMVFTWNDDLVNCKDVVKVNYSFDFSYAHDVQRERYRDICLIAANKKSSARRELYSERLKAIKWFENNAADRFDFYGVGWDRKSYSDSFIGKVLNKFLSYKVVPSMCYKGVVELKSEIYKNYKFSICYENVYGDSGYITEKIFDSFFSGCIPVYFGAKNITKYVPSDCFIDFREFLDYDELNTYLQELSDEELVGFRCRINNYLKSELSIPFRKEYFAKTVVENTLKIYDKKEINIIN